MTIAGIRGAREYGVACRVGSDDGASGGNTVNRIVIIGGGIAGASMAWRLAKHRRVLLVERESQCGYHTTGRSAALYMETYGTPRIIDWLNERGIRPDMILSRSSVLFIQRLPVMQASRKPFGVTSDTPFIRESTSAKTRLRRDAYASRTAWSRSCCA